MKPRQPVVITDASKVRLPQGRTVLEVATGQQPKRMRRDQFAEFREQCLFVQWCDMHPDVKGLAYSATMQGINLPALQAKLAKAKGVKRGQPDFYLFHPEAWHAATGIRAVGLALEFKNPNERGRVSADQQRWREMLLASGWRYEVVTSWTAAKMITTTYLDLKR